MFEFIIGDVVNIKNDFIIINNNGIGYKIFASTNTMSKIDLGANTKIFTQMHVRDDAILLFGFADEDEVDIFNNLLLVSKVGPKMALSILSTLSPNKLRRAILNNNISELCKSPGVGKKTAERIVVELKDRIEKNGNIELNSMDIDDYNTKNNSFDEVVQALTGLGYASYEVERVLRGIYSEEISLENMIKECLIRLSK